VLAWRPVRDLRFNFMCLFGSVRRGGLRQNPQPLEFLGAWLRLETPALIRRCSFPLRSIPRLVEEIESLIIFDRSGFGARSSYRGMGSHEMVRVGVQTARSVTWIVMPHSKPTVPCATLEERPCFRCSAATIGQTVSRLTYVEPYAGVRCAIKSPLGRKVARIGLNDADRSVWSFCIDLHHTESIRRIDQGDSVSWPVEETASDLPCRRAHSRTWLLRRSISTVQSSGIMTTGSYRGLDKQVNGNRRPI